MESIIKLLKALFETLGFKVAAIVLLTILFVNLLKKPIIAKAEKYAEKYDCDKSVITRYVAMFPFIVSFIIAFIWELVMVDFIFAQIDYEMLLTNVVVYGCISIAAFEILKLQFEAYAARKKVKEKKADKEEKKTQEKTNNVNKNVDIL